MQQLNLKQQFVILNSAHRTIYEYELFGTPVEEYWYLNDVLCSFDDALPKTSYKNITTLEQILRTSTPQQIYSRKPERLDEIVATNMPRPIPDGKDLEMSPYACWALMKYIGDDAVFQREYFLKPDASFGELVSIANETARIPWRKFVASYEAQLSGILGKFNKTVSRGNSTYYAPRNNNSYITLRHDINNILYDNVSQYEIRKHYNIPQDGTRKPTLSDYMNFYLLRAYGTMLYKIVHDFDTDTSNQTYTKLTTIAQHRAQEAHNNFKHGALYNNFSTQSISEIIKNQNQREIEFAKQHVSSR